MNKITSIEIKKVLVIDDNQEIQQLLKMSLEIMKPWQILTADSGIKGLKIAREEKNIDLILLDYLMPESNGEEIIIELQKDKAISHIPVIFLTAQSDTQFEGKKLGASGVIYKPFNPITIADLITEIMEEE
jgi:CheY-like chemotaxis protein